MGLAIAFVLAFAAADRARRREASAVGWGIATMAACLLASMVQNVVPPLLVGALMVVAAEKLGKTSKRCDACGKSTPIDALACPHCGASPKTMFMAGQ
jgi:hypothetical protein